MEMGTVCSDHFHLSCLVIKNNHIELRVCSVIGLALNEERYLSEGTFKEMAEYSYDGVMDYTIQVSISDGSFVPNDKYACFRNAVMLSAKSGTYASLLHIATNCIIFSTPINSIYPTVQNPCVDRDVHNQVFFPVCKIYNPNSLNEIVTILWTHTSNKNLRGWKPNHFVPCFLTNIGYSCKYY